MSAELKQAWGAQLWKRLRSPRLTLFTLSFFALFCGIACWLPWVAAKNVQPPAWSIYVGLDRPFSSAPFLLACILLFVNTLACTLERWKKIMKLWRAEFQGRTLSPPLPCEESEQFLLGQGFRKVNGTFYRYRFALWGGVILHVGILLLLLAVTIQRSAFDGGAFQLVEGQKVNLQDQGAVFDREKGWFAPAVPPDLEAVMTSFDAFLHQEGYAPDRASRLRISTSRGTVREALVDRSRGVSIGATTVYQAIPSGLALYVDIEGMGARAIHLGTVSEFLAATDLRDPAGSPARLLVKSERRLDDPLGTGPLHISLEQHGLTSTLQPGVPFRFGPVAATISSVTRWSGFTYSRTPGIGLVFLAFGLILSGCFLLIFPAGIARIGDFSTTTIYAPRGLEALQAEWEAYCMASRRDV